MELFLLKFVSVVRPLGSMQYAEAIVDVVGVGLFALLVLALLSNGAIRKAVKFSAVDLVITAFVLWCVAVYLIYIEYAYIRDVAKLLIPMLGYIVAKNTLRTKKDYRNLLGWMIVSFSVPTILSAVMIVNGTGVDFVSYWTGITRWAGVYDGAHTLGLSMTLLLITITLYVTLAGGDATSISGIGVIKKAGLVLLSGTALYCLYMSQVRTAVIGIMVFAVIYLFYLNRKVLAIGTIVGIIAGVASLPYWLPTLLPEFAMREMGIAVDTSDLGSGRPNMWHNDIMVFSTMPIDRQIAGVGIGNRGSQSAEQMIYGHSDWLELLVQTGIVGVIMYLAFQFLFLRAILRLPGRERYAFLAVFFSVNVMMLVSNAFAWRIQVSQLYFILFAYVETRFSLPEQRPLGGSTVK